MENHILEQDLSGSRQELSVVDGAPGKLFIGRTELEAELDKMAEAINRDYAGLNPVVVSILKGAVYFIADLTRRLTIPINIDFLAISRYGTHESDPAGGKRRPANHRGRTGAVRITKDLDLDIHGRHVLMVEDVIDTGLTLGYVLRSLRARGPASLNVCTLLDNPARRLVDLPVRYRGFTIPDHFLVGYGLDYQENYRHLPEIFVLKKK